jgi:hypothetical protein
MIHVSSLELKKIIKCVVLAIQKWGCFGKITFILKNSGGVLVKSGDVLVVEAF